MDFMPAIQATSDALGAEKKRLELIASNIANAQTTRDVDGNPYQRKVAVFEAYMRDAGNGSSVESVRVAKVLSDPSPGPTVYNPSHPHADENGMVHYPNVQGSREMVDLIMASRAYEANLSILRTSRQLMQQTMQIGR